ncbi:MAG: hypothetical protein M8350_00615 [Methanosarcinaceae archaeon]|nr:hypothetical protein [Methanosarcinaceae archaeon]
MDKETIKKLIILAQERDVKFAQRDTQIYFSGMIKRMWKYVSLVQVQNF